MSSVPKIVTSLITNEKYKKSTRKKMIISTRQNIRLISFLLLFSSSKIRPNKKTKNLKKCKHKFKDWGLLKNRPKPCIRDMDPAIKSILHKILKNRKNESNANRKKSKLSSSFCKNLNNKPTLSKKFLPNKTLRFLLFAKISFKNPVIKSLRRREAPKAKFISLPNNKWTKWKHFTSKSLSNCKLSTKKNLLNTKKRLRKLWQKKTNAYKGSTS